MDPRPVRRALALAALAALLLVPGCEDLPLGPGGQVTGLTIRDGAGATLVTVAGAAVSGQLVVARDASLPLTITLRGAEGPVSPGPGESIRVSITNPGVASWQDAGGGGGTLRGASTGTTGLRVDLLRAGVVVYTSPSIPVSVS